MRLLLLLGAASLTLPVNAADAPTPVGFRVSGVAFSLQLPEGYCLPEGSQIDVAQMMTAADSNSVTHLSLFRCGVKISTGANDYTLIKTPNMALTMAVDRPQLLASLGAEFEKPETLKYLQSDDFNKGVSDDVGRVIPGKPQFAGDVRPVGRDNVCAYMGGVTKVSAAGTSYVQAVGTCITSVGNRVIMVARYGIRTDDLGIAKLLREARALALAIKPNR